MGKRAGTALRLISWFTRAIEFCCAALILALFSFFLATLASNDLAIGQWIRAVEGIAGAAVLYTLITLLLLFCVAGHPVLSPIFMFLDICFFGAFIYLAAANRHGASSCDGQVTTPLGSGNASTNIVDNGRGGLVTLDPNLRQACKMQSACLAVAIVGLLFFILSAILEILLMRHRRKEKRFGPSPINGYTSGYGKTSSSPHRKGGGLFSRFSRRKKRGTDLTDNSNALPHHPQPDDLRDSTYTPHNRASTYNTGITDTTMTTTEPEDILPPPNTSTTTTTGTTGTTQPPMSGVNTGYGIGSYGSTKPEENGLDPGAYTRHREYANRPTSGTTPGAVGTTTTTTSTTNNTAPSPPPRFPPGNYRYDDGVYDRM